MCISGVYTELNVIVVWYPARSPKISEYQMDMAFHHIDSISAATKHTLLLRPSGSFEYVLQQVCREWRTCRAIYIWLAANGSVILFRSASSSS